MIPIQKRRLGHTTWPHWDDDSIFGLGNDPARANGTNHSFIAQPAVETARIIFLQRFRAAMTFARLRHKWTKATTSPSRGGVDQKMGYANNVSTKMHLRADKSIIEFVLIREHFIKALRKERNTKSTLKRPPFKSIRTTMTTPNI